MLVSKWLLAGFCLAFLWCGLAFAQDNDNLLEILKQKGILTCQEVERINQKNAKQDSENPASLMLVYDNGFCLQSKEKTTSLCLKALLQADYRFLDYEPEPEYAGVTPGTDKFDIRRARLIVTGRAHPFFSYKFSYEFEGASSRNLLDAYANVQFHPAFNLRIGQFKEPFGLEASSSDTNLFFTERSIGYCLNPQRDLGAMAYGDFFSGSLFYEAGIFNGDGRDDSVGGNVDEPEACARVIISPFLLTDMDLIKGLSFGASGSYVRTDINNVNIKLETSGQTVFFSVASRAKFNIIYGCDNLTRQGAEVAWTFGPCALFGEYMRTEFDNIKTSSDNFNVELTGGYLAGTWIITGEPISISQGRFQEIVPKAPLGKGGAGAFGVGYRYDKLDADDQVYDVLVYPGDSVRQATAHTLGVNWYLNEFARFCVEATRTEFDRPLKTYRDPFSGTSLYTDQEDVLVCRFQLEL